MKGNVDVRFRLRIVKGADIAVGPGKVDLLEAIADSGFRNYTGFRRGAHVVYYGEYHPDMATVFGKMGQTEVNTRWGQAFEGIITKITDEAGNLITADEVYHQD